MADLLKEQHGRMCLANLDENVRALFEISSCDRALEAKRSVREAIEAVS